MSFPRYSKYKPSGVEWLGDVPEGWVVCAPKRRIKSAAGGTLIKGMCSDEFSEGLFPGFSASGQNVWLEEYAYDCPAIVLSAVGARCGKAFKADGKWGVVANTHCLFPLPNSDRDYLWYLTNQEDWWEKGGSAQPFVKVSETMARPWVFPPLPEQTAIAEFLDRETGKIDGLVAEQRRLMELLKEEIESLVLASVNSPDTEHLRFGYVATLISRPVLQQQEEAYTRIGLFNRGRGLFHKDASEMDEMGISDFFWIEEGDLIISGQFAWEGAVAMAGKNETGCVVSHRYPVIRGKTGVALTEYLFALLSTDHGDFLLNEHSRGAAGRNRPLNIRTLMKEVIPTPSMRTQETVARAVHAKTAISQEISNTISLLQERRTALISAAVTGQIDVRQQPRN